MINFDFQKNCTGCGACYNICPVSAVSMVEDDEGFLIPKVNIEKCISCGMCDKICPHLNHENLKLSSSEMKWGGVWLYSSKDTEAKLKSSSGAACYELGRAVIKKGGIISGCAWDGNLVAVHIIGSDEETLKRMQGSKYVQSNTGNIYSEIEKHLKKGKFVLFTGTPCQATAAHNYIMGQDNGKYREKLLTVAVICHGVASPLVWESYKKWDAERVGSPLVNVNFRDKSKEGYKKSYCKFEYLSGAVIYHPTYLPSSKYMEATIVYNLAMRNCCTHCECKGVNKGIDLIVGDWYAANTGEGQLGTSCIVAFTDRGRKFAEENLVGLREFSYEKILKDNSFIETSITESKNRALFFKKIRDYHFWDRVENLYPPKYKFKTLLIRLKLYDLIKKIIVR